MPLVVALKAVEAVLQQNGAKHEKADSCGSVYIGQQTRLLPL